MPLRFAERAEEAHDYQLTIGALLESAMVAAAEQEIVYRGDLRLSYREVRARVGRLASVLAAHGVEQGMTVGVLDWDSHRYLEAYFAIPMMGAVLQTVNVRLSPQQVAYTLNHAGAAVLVCHHDFFLLLDVILPHCPGVKAVIAIRDGTAAALPPYAVGEYEALLAAADPDFAFEAFDENAIATTFYTTGTTGDPKGVSFSHRQIVLQTLSVTGPFGATRERGFGIDDVYMPLTPMFHVHAWGVPYAATMMGVKQVYPGRYDFDAIVRLRAAEGVSYSHGVPSILQMVLAAADRTGASLSGWLMLIGGSALNTALFAEARARGMEITCGYGMSETAPMISIAHRRPGTAPGDEADVEALLSAGSPAPLVHVRVVDEAMRDVASDGETRGEIVVRSPWVTQAYVGDARASAALWRGGWLHTQDVATIDDHGVIRVRDRLKDVIKTGGEWVSSIDLEDMLSLLPCVAEVAVVGVPDARWGERPVAVAVAAPGQRPTLERLNAPIAEAVADGRLSRYALIDRLHLVDALPRTSVGKIDKKLLRARIAAAFVTASDPMIEQEIA